jgi:hypothetical protein
VITCIRERLGGILQSIREVYLIHHQGQREVMMLIIITIIIRKEEEVNELVVDILENRALCALQVKSSQVITQ